MELCCWRLEERFALGGRQWEDCGMTTTKVSGVGCQVSGSESESSEA
jgi:hypothetical protein